MRHLSGFTVPPKQEATLPVYIVMTSSAKMPRTVKAPYRRVAVVGLTAEYALNGWKPKMISTRARGVERIIELGHYPTNGSSMKSGLQQALQRAADLADKLNKEQEANT